MAQQNSLPSVLSSSSPSPTWREIHANPNNSSIMKSSLTNLSNHLDLSEHVENQFWSQALVSIGSGGGIRYSSEDGESFLQLLSSGSSMEEMFEPACNYLKKFDSGWDFMNQCEVSTGDMSINPSTNHYLTTDISDIKQEHECSPSHPNLNDQEKKASIPSFWRPLNFRSFTGDGELSVGFETSSSTRRNGRGSGTSEGKKIRAENKETLFKRPKHQVSSAKLQGPKVKLLEREKITALQQIVSPFGRTDTSSVLLEAIRYIKNLQEQIQLLSDPYMKSRANKDHYSWIGLERNDKVEQKFDLRSRGLCLLPIDCIPQAYRDDNGPDFWRLPYRGCTYK